LQRVKKAIKYHKEEKRIIGRKGLRDKVSSFLKFSPKISDFSVFINAINSYNLVSQHFGLIGLRKLLCDRIKNFFIYVLLSFAANRTPIQETIDTNMIPKLIELIKNDNEPHLQVNRIIFRNILTENSLKLHGFLLILLREQQNKLKLLSIKELYLS